MTKPLRQTGIIVLLNLFWIIFLDTITVPWVLTGFVLSLVTALLTSYLFDDPYGDPIDLRFILSWMRYGVNLLAGIVISGIRLIPVLIQGTDRPIVFLMKVDHADPLVHTLVANAITLTPGTITLEASDDGELIILSMVDDGQDGATFAEDIIRQYVRPFTRITRQGVIRP